MQTIIGSAGLEPQDVAARLIAVGTYYFINRLTGDIWGDR